MKLVQNLFILMFISDVMTDSFLVYLSSNDSISAYLCNVTEIPTADDVTNTTSNATFDDVTNMTSNTTFDDVTNTTSNATFDDVTNTTSNATFDDVITTTILQPWLNLSACDVIDKLNIGGNRLFATSNVTINCTELNENVLDHNQVSKIFGGLSGLFHNLSLVNCHLLHEMLKTEFQITSIYGLKLIQIIEGSYANGFSRDVINVAHASGRHTGFRSLIQLHSSALQRWQRAKSFSVFDLPSQQQIDHVHQLVGYHDNSVDDTWMITVIYT